MVYLFTTAIVLVIVAVSWMFAGCLIHAEGEVGGPETGAAGIPDTPSTPGE